MTDVSQPSSEPSEPSPSNVTPFLPKQKELTIEDVFDYLTQNTGIKPSANKWQGGTEYPEERNARIARENAEHESRLRREDAADKFRLEKEARLQEKISDNAYKRTKEFSTYGLAGALIVCLALVCIITHFDDKTSS